MTAAGRTVVLVVCVLMLGGCRTYTPAPAFTPTPRATQQDAARSESPEVVAFRAQRDVICRTASKDVAAATVESMGGSLERTVAALSRMVERVAQTQQQLDRLEPPTALAPFAAEDAARRRTRVRLLRRSIRALEHGNDADAASAALSRLVAKGQAAEAAQGLVSCP